MTKFKHRTWCRELRSHVGWWKCGYWIHNGARKLIKYKFVGIRDITEKDDGWATSSSHHIKFAPFWWFLQTFWKTTHLNSAIWLTMTHDSLGGSIPLSSSQSLDQVTFHLLFYFSHDESLCFVFYYLIFFLIYSSWFVMQDLLQSEGILSESFLEGWVIQKNEPLTYTWLPLWKVWLQN